MTIKLYDKPGQDISRVYLKKGPLKHSIVIIYGKLKCQRIWTRMVKRENKILNRIENEKSCYYLHITAAYWEYSSVIYNVNRSTKPQ